MKLILNYEELINQRMKEYIRNQYADNVVSSLHRITAIWEEEKEKQRLEAGQKEGHEQTSDDE